jgi:hypothetical protein
VASRAAAGVRSQRERGARSSVPDCALGYIPGRRCVPRARRRLAAAPGPGSPSAPRGVAVARGVRRRRLDSFPEAAFCGWSSWVLWTAARSRVSRFVSRRGVSSSTLSFVLRLRDLGAARWLGAGRSHYESQRRLVVRVCPFIRGWLAGNPGVSRLAFCLERRVYG